MSVWKHTRLENYTHILARVSSFCIASVAVLIKQASRLVQLASKWLLINQKVIYGK